MSRRVEPPPELDEFTTYVVNLRRRVDRRARMEAMLPAALCAEFTSDWDVLMDGWDLTPDALTAHGYKLFDWQTSSDNPWWSRPLKWGEVGCSIAHLACWQRAAQSGRRFCLVLEDDICLDEAFVDQLLTGLTRLADEPWDLLYLGRFWLEPDQTHSPGFVVPGCSHCSYGYVLTQRGVQRLLEADLARAIIPVDEFLPAMYLDHPRRDVRIRFPKRLNTLAFEPPLVTQLPKDLAGSDTEDSAFVTPV